MQYQFDPIGFVRCKEKFEFEAPRQGAFADNRGVIELVAGKNFEQALEDLSGFERIWVVFVFDRNNHWSPKTHPPVGANGRAIGVFATRSPYRPNPIGISSIKLLSVHGRKLEIADFDMLDGTPVLDIKPYIPCADAFVGSQTGWLKEHTDFKVNLASEFLKSAQFLTQVGGIDVANFAEVQLKSFNPTRQRIQKISEHLYEIGCRTWRIGFTLEEESKTISVTYLKSSYSPAELMTADDPYQEKELHRIMQKSNMERTI